MTTPYTSPFAFKSEVLDALYVENVGYKVDEAKRRLDVDWVSDSFFSPRSEMVGDTKQWSFMSSADHKFTDSQWGGNFAVNTRPQYTPLSDPRRIGTVMSRKSIFEADADPILSIRNLGMGRIYSEQYDDNAHRIYLRFGVPQYNSLTKFLENMSSSQAVSIATTGSSFSLSRIVGTIIAAKFMWSVSPITSVLMMFSKAASFIFQNRLLAGTNQFYSLKSVQGRYWDTVQSMINEYMVATNMLRYEGTVLKGWDYLTGATKKEDIRESMKPDGEGPREDLKYIATLLPEVFDENFGFNVVKLMGRAGRRSVGMHEELNDFKFQSQDPTAKIMSYTEAVIESIKLRAEGKQENLANTHSIVSTASLIQDAFVNKVVADFDSIGADVSKEDIELAIRSYHSSALWFTAIQSVWFNPGVLGRATLDTIYEVGRSAVDLIRSGIAGATGQEADVSEDTRGAAYDIEGARIMSQDAAAHVNIQSGINDKRTEQEKADSQAAADGIVAHLDYSLKFGLEFVQFEVNYTPQVQEGVSNNIQPAPLGEMLKGVAGTARSFKNMVANGNISDGVIGGIVETVVGVAGGAIAGAASLLSFNLSDSILDVLQGAQIDMPQFWESSSAQLPVATYTMQLRAGGGDFLSQLKGVYIPLFCILAGGFPQGVGESSHVHPFYCQLYDKGRLNKPCSMITNVSISRGVGNLGYDDSWRALAIDVTFDVTDLTPVVAVPAMPGMLVPGHPMTNYIWALASTELDVYINGLTSMSNSVERLGRRFNSFFDKANMANRAGEYIKGSGLRHLIITSYALQAATSEYSNNVDPSR